MDVNSDIDKEKKRLKALAKCKERYNANVEAYKRRIYNTRYQKWGSSLKEKEEIWERQQHKCDICGKKIPMLESPFDHDHKKNKVRGVLCDTCNKVLGNFKDNPKYLINAIFYLKKFGSF